MCHIRVLKIHIEIKSNMVWIRHIRLDDKTLNVVSEYKIFRQDFNVVYWCHFEFGKYRLCLIFPSKTLAAECASCDERSIKGQQRLLLKRTFNAPCIWRDYHQIKVLANCTILRRGEDRKVIAAKIGWRHSLEYTGVSQLKERLWSELTLLSLFSLLWSPWLFQKIWNAL